MRNIAIVLLVLTVSACASSRGFDRGELRGSISEQKVVTEEDIQRAIETRPQLPAPFTLAIYFSPNNSGHRYGESSWRWEGEDKDRLLEISQELKSKNIISEAIIISDSVVGGVDNKSIRLAAARAGADAVLIVNGVSATEHYNNDFGATYILLVTAFFVPGTVIDSLFMINASMWDVRNQYLYLSVEAEGSAKEARPAVFAEDSRVIKAAKTDAMVAIAQEISSHLTGMAVK